jgi:hypothetical protein
MSSDLNVHDLSTGGKIGLMPDKPDWFQDRGRATTAVGTAVNLSGPNGRGLLHALPPLRLGSPEGHSMTYLAVYSFLRFELLDNCSRRRGMGGKRDPRIHAPGFA